MITDRGPPAAPLSDYFQRLSKAIAVMPFGQNTSTEVQGRRKGAVMRMQVKCARQILALMMLMPLMLTGPASAGGSAPALQVITFVAEGGNL